MARQWWHRSLIQACGRERQVNFFEFKTSLVYRASVGTARVTQRNPAWENNQTNKNKNREEIKRI